MDWKKLPVEFTDDGQPLITEPLHWEYRREGNIVHVRTTSTINGAEIAFTYAADTDTDD